MPQIWDKNRKGARTKHLINKYKTRLPVEINRFAAFTHELMKNSEYGCGQVGREGTLDCKLYWCPKFYEDNFLLNFGHCYETFDWLVKTNI